MTDPELNRLELMERAAREIYDRLMRADDASRRGRLIATAKRLWEEADATLSAYRAKRRD